LRPRTRTSGDGFPIQANPGPPRPAWLDKRHDRRARAVSSRIGTLFCAPHPKRCCIAKSSHAIGNKQFTAGGRG
jgi:hypothetical protein